MLVADQHLLAKDNLCLLVAERALIVVILNQGNSKRSVKMFELCIGVEGNVIGRMRESSVRSIDLLCVELKNACASKAVSVSLSWVSSISMISVQRS